MMIAAHYKSGNNNNKSDNNEDKVGGSRARPHTKSRARSHDNRSCDYGVTLEVFLETFQG